MPELESEITPTALRLALKSMPEKLLGIYHQSMRRIEDFPPEARRLARKALAWLVLAKRPLQSTELQHALGIDENSSEFNIGNIPEIEEIVAVCQGFVTYDEREAIVRLAHFTVYEFLQDIMQEWHPNPRAMVAKDCIVYLSLDAFCSGFCKSDEEFELRSRDFPFYRYAAQHWAIHLRETSSLPELMIRSFLMDNAKVASASQAMLVYGQHSHQYGYSQRVTEQVTGLHLAAYSGLTSVVKLLLEEGHKPAPKDSEGRTPLWHAAEKNHGEIMRLLSDVDRMTFTMVLNEGKETLVSSLLQNASQNIKDVRLKTALHMGVLYDDLRIMDQALRCGADINSKDGDGNTPIQLAFQERKPQAIDWLLSKSAETTNITVDDWFRVYRKPKSDVVKLSEEKSGQKEVKFFSLREFGKESAFRAETWKRLLYAMLFHKKIRPPLISSE
ncbi:MAG: hypothetical protein M1822_000280 [Bathelium mastoideum]|nr:MAG: hypothetical protein M1822_000280 [Bathelium mastoideum]